MSKIERIILKILAGKSLKILFFAGALSIVVSISVIIFYTKYADSKNEAGTARIIDLSMTAESAYAAKHSLSETKYFIESFLHTQNPANLEAAVANFGKYNRFITDVINSSSGFNLERISSTLKQILDQTKNQISIIKASNATDLALQKMAFSQSFAALAKQNEKAIDTYVDTMFDKKIEAIETLNESRNKMKIVDFSISIGTIFISIISLLFMYMRIRPLNNIITRLTSQSGTVSNASDSILLTASNLQKTSLSQSAAAIETSASVEEITQMSEKTSGAATNLLRNVESSTTAVIEGKKFINEMLEVMKKIDINSQNVSTEVTSSNKQIQEIVTVISDIAEKTKVINDIVFQTKLLSFNASVEAARAGESGKGFAVVAQEIGNLAQMSGQSAQDISATLTVGIETVGKIISNSKRKLDELTSLGRDSIKFGNEKAFNCEKSFDEVSVQISQVETASKEINQSIIEQAAGLTEISKAVSVFDTSSTENLTASEKTFSEATELKTQSLDLQKIITELEIIANGQISRR